MCPFQKQCRLSNLWKPQGRVGKGKFCFSLLPFPKSPQKPEARLLQVGSELGDMSQHPLESLSSRSWQLLPLVCSVALFSKRILNSQKNCTGKDRSNI